MPTTGAAVKVCRLCRWNDGGFPLPDGRSSRYRRRPRSVSDMGRHGNVKIALVHVTGMVVPVRVGGQIVAGGG
jgi:hypothetical protein